MLTPRHHLCIVVLVLCSVIPACSGSGSELTENDTAASRAVEAATDAHGSDDVMHAVSDDVGETLDDVEGPSLEDAEPSSEYPDPTFVHGHEISAIVSAQASYNMDESTLFRSETHDLNLDITALAITSDDVDAPWVGTASGLFRFEPQSEQFQMIGPDDVASPAVVAIAQNLDSEGRLVVLYEDRLDRISPMEAVVEEQLFVTAGATSVVVSADAVWIGDAQGLHQIVDGELEQVDTMQSSIFPPITSLSVDATDTLWIGSPEGLLSWNGEFLTHHINVDVRAVTASSETGAIWAATSDGIVHVQSAMVTEIPAGVGFLPSDDVIAVAAGAGRVVLGHGVGGTALEVTEAGDIEHVEHYIGQRWLPSNDVQAVAISSADRYWYGTSAGLTRVDWKAHIFHEKATYFEDLLDSHFWRMDGFVSPRATLDDPWEPSSWSLNDNDNDGLWTQMQIGAFCYAYAVTGESAYYDKAKKAIETMYLLIDIPGVDFESAGLGRGFVARSLVRDDEGEIFEDKVTRDNWHLVHWEGHDYYWKDDTSSDETTGHFFGYPLYFDLCAQDDEEKAVVAEHAAVLASYILDAGYVLIDLDGEQTLHGHWQPERIGSAAEGIDNCEADFEWCGESYFGGGWLNGLEILGHMLAAWHMTGETRFYDAYESLIAEHHYDQLVIPHQDTITITEPAFMNHSDHELAMLAYHTLIRYEPNEVRRTQWIEGLKFLYEWELDERNPLWAGFVALLAGEASAELADAVDSLQQMPLDSRSWRIDNSHRKDALAWPNDRHDNPQWDRVFPYDEIRTIWWNGNFHAMTYGGDGTSMRGPMAWLLPYWLLRYSGVIGE